MRARSHAVPFLILVVLTLSCQPQVDEVITSLQEDLDAIEAQATAFSDAVKILDFDAAAATMTEDVVIMVPNQSSIVGRQAWSDWVETWGIIGIPKYDLGIEDIHVSGDLAYVRGTFSEILNLEGVEEPFTEEGKYLQIWQKDANGSWWIAVDCWNSNLPLPE